MGLPPGTAVCVCVCEREREQEDLRWLDYRISALGRGRGGAAVGGAGGWGGSAAQKIDPGAALLSLFRTRESSSPGN